MGQFTWGFWLETENHRYDIVYKTMDQLLGMEFKAEYFEELPPGATYFSDKKIKDLNARMIQKFYEDPDNIWENMKNDREYTEDCSGIQVCLDIRRYLL